MVVQSATPVEGELNLCVALLRATKQSKLPTAYKLNTPGVFIMKAPFFILLIQMPSVSFIVDSPWQPSALRGTKPSRKLSDFVMAKHEANKPIFNLPDCGARSNPGNYRILSWRGTKPSRRVRISLLRGAKQSCNYRIFVMAMYEAIQEN
jgi:hypothetical protein